MSAVFLQTFLFVELSRIELESNIFVISFLLVYYCIDCRETAGAARTNHFLR